MSIFACFKAKNWIEGTALDRLRRDRRIQTVLKNKKISTLTILILISGCFFYNQIKAVFPHCYADDYRIDGYIENEKEWIAKINYADSFLSKQKEKQNSNGYPFNNKIEVRKELGINDKELIAQFHQLVGNAPIKEMIPSILKLDKRVAAFVVGIAKKESDWGKHAPSLSGKTCYNYWGYKGQGSRGTSMGYACFGSPEEAVSIVGKRIENLIAKNINEPRKMLVWKCGSSCAGHDPSGVQKWVSDVSLYYGKVMKIQNT